jgi:S-layer protein
MQTQIANLYISILGRNPDPVGFGYWCDAYANANGTQAALDAIASGFGKSPEFTGIYSGQTVANAVALMYNNILGRTQDAGGATYWQGIANGYITSGKTIGDAYALTANAMITAAAANTGTADATLIASKQATAVTAGTSTPTTTYTLTTSTDIQTAGLFYGTVNAATGVTFTAGDQLTGQGSNATLNLADAGAAGLTTALITPGAATLTNIKNLVINGSNVAASTVNTAGAPFTGVTSVTINEGGQVDLTGSATQALSLNLSASAALASAVNGGAAVTVTSADATTGTLNIGQTTAGTGTASATVTGLAYTATDANNTMGVINIRSGTSAVVTANAFANTTAAATDTFNTTRTMGAVAIDGTSTTASASVTESNAVVARGFAAGTANSYATTGFVGVTNSAVTIRDATAIAGSQASTAGTLTTVSLSGYGASSTISSNALTTLNLSGTGGTLGITTGLTSPTNRTLAINTNALTNRDAGLNAVNGGDTTITDSTAPSGLGFTTFNVTNTGSSRINGISAVDLTALNVGGSGTLTISAVGTGMTTLQTITVTGTAGLSIASRVGTDAAADLSTSVTSINASGTSGAVSINMSGLETIATYTGGSGVDTVTITAAVTKAINGGSGSADVIINNANSDIVTGNPLISGFEILRAGTAATGTLNANGFTGLQMGVVTGAITFTNVAAGTALTIDRSTGSGATYNLVDSSGTSDSVRINLNTGTASGNAAIVAGTVTTTGIESITIAMTDTPTAAITAYKTGRDAALVNSITLDNATATSITVTGNAGLTLTNTALDKVASFDASGVVAGTALAAGAVTYTSATTKANSLTTTIKGGAGADALTGGATADTIDGGSGSDILDGGLGADTITGGAGSGDELRFATITNNVSTEGAGAGTIQGVVVNLSSAAVSAATINTALGGTRGISGSLVSVASGATAYTYSTQDVAFSTVSDTITGVERVVGTAGFDYIATSTIEANRITGGRGADVIVAGRTDAGVINTLAHQFVLNSTIGTASDSGQVVIAGAGNDVGQDTYTNVNFSTSTFRVVGAAVGSFDEASQVVIGTGGAGTSGTAASFTASTALIYIDGSNATFDAGDMAITFSTPSTTLSAAGIRAILQYDLTTATGSNNAVVTGVLNDALRASTQAGTDKDTFTGGAGSDNFIFATRANAINAAGGANDTAVLNDQIVDFVVGTDVITLGTGTNAFGTALTFTTGTGVNINAVTALGNVTFTDFTALAAAVQTARGGVASSATTAQVYVVTAGTITTATGFSNKTFIVINDDTAAIAATDTWIDVTGINTTALTAASFGFGAGVIL